MKKRMLVWVVSLFAAFSLCACGGDKKETGSGNGNGGNMFGDGGETLDPDYGGYQGDDGYGYDGGDDGGWTDQAQDEGRKPAKPGADINPAVFHRTREDEGIDIWMYLVWDEDGSNMRIVFFGDGNEGEVLLTEMDQQYFYGTADSAVKVNGKGYGGAEFAIQQFYEGYANMQIKGSGEEEFLGMDGVTSIKAVPEKYKGIFFGYYLDPLMTISGDEYRISAEIKGGGDTYTIKDIFYCADIWSEEKIYELRNLESLTYHPDAYDYFSVSEDYYGNDRTVNLTWMRYDENGERDDSISELSTYYYRFVDHKAPADFVNRDGEGKWGAMAYDAADTVFVPKTDDYIVYRSVKQIGVYDDAASEYRTYDADVYELYAFDGHGLCVQSLQKSIFESETGAQAYKGYMGNYYDLTVAGNIVYEERTARDRGYGKSDRLSSVLGGDTTYSDHHYYEGVHYYQFKDEWNDTLKEVYISVLPRKLTQQEHQRIIDHCGKYAISDTAAIHVGFDMTSYYLYVQESNLIDDLWVYEYVRNLEFDEKGFTGYMEKTSVKMIIRGEYEQDGLKVTYTIYPAVKDNSTDSGYGDYTDEGQTMEKIYPFASREFQH